MSQAGFSEAFVVAGEFNTSAPTPTPGQKTPIQVDSSGNLLVNVAVGSTTNPSVGTNGTTAPTSSTEIGTIDATGKLQGASTSNPVPTATKKFGQILTTTPLAANGTFASAWVDTNQTGDAYVTVVAFANQASASFSVVIQSTDDTTNTNTQQNLVRATVNANQVTPLATNVSQRYWRVVYTNGATAQATFELTSTASNIVPPQMLGVNGVNGNGTSNGGAVGGFNPVAVSSSGSVSVGYVNSGGGDGAIQGVVSGFFIGVAPALTTGAAAGTNTALQRTPAIFKTAKATATGTTPVWTPASGKKFRLMRFKIIVTADSKQTTPGEVDFDLQDSTTSINLIHTVFIPSTAGATLAGFYDSGWVDLGNGYLSTTANNVLNLVFTASGFVGAVRIIACGTEE